MLYKISFLELYAPKQWVTRGKCEIIDLYNWVNCDFNSKLDVGSLERLKENSWSLVCFTRSYNYFSMQQNIKHKHKTHNNANTYHLHNSDPPILTLRPITRQWVTPKSTLYFFLLKYTLEKEKPHTIWAYNHRQQEDTMLQHKKYLQDETLLSLFACLLSFTFDCSRNAPSVHYQNPHLKGFL